MCNLCHLLGIYGVVENHKFCASNLNLSLGVEQLHTLHSRSSPLVELTRQALHSEVGHIAQLNTLAHIVRSPLAKDTIFALFEQFGGKAKEVIDAQEAQRGDIESKIGVEFLAQALRLHPKRLTFFDKYAMGIHLFL